MQMFCLILKIYVISYWSYHCSNKKTKTKNWPACEPLKTKPPLVCPVKYLFLSVSVRRTGRTDCADTRRDECRQDINKPFSLGRRWQGCECEIQRETGSRTGTCALCVCSHVVMKYRSPFVSAWRREILSHTPPERVSFISCCREKKKSSLSKGLCYYTRWRVKWYGDKKNKRQRAR